MPHARADPKLLVNCDIFTTIFTKEGFDQFAKWYPAMMGVVVL